jgi:hypothetical protein
VKPRTRSKKRSRSSRETDPHKEDWCALATRHLSEGNDFGSSGKSHSVFKSKELNRNARSSGSKRWNGPDNDRDLWVFLHEFLLMSYALSFSFAMSADCCPSRGQVLISEIVIHPMEAPAFNADGTPVLDLYEDVHELSSSTTAKRQSYRCWMGTDRWRQLCVPGAA